MTPDPHPIVLSNSYVGVILETRPVLESFPHLGEIRKNLGQAQLVKCGSCRSGKVDEQFQRARSFIMSMSDADLDQLKTLLGVGGRQFVSNTGPNGISGRTVR